MFCSHPGSHVWMNVWNACTCFWRGKLPPLSFHGILTDSGRQGKCLLEVKMQKKIPKEELIFFSVVDTPQRNELWNTFRQSAFHLCPHAKIMSDSYRLMTNTEVTEWKKLLLKAEPSLFSEEEADFSLCNSRQMSVWSSINSPDNWVASRLLLERQVNQNLNVLKTNQRNLGTSIFCFSLTFTKEVNLSDFK